MIILVCLIIWPCALNLWRRWWAIDFQVPERPFFVFCTNRAQSLYLVTVFPYSIHKNFFLFAHFTSILQRLSRLSYNSCLIYLCSAGEVVFRFLPFGFINHTTRISNKTSFLCKRLVVKNKFRYNLSRFTKLKCFALDIQSQRI